MINMGNLWLRIVYIGINWIVDLNHKEWVFPEAKKNKWSGFLDFSHHFIGAAGSHLRSQTGAIPKDSRWWRMTCWPFFVEPNKQTPRNQWNKPGRHCTTTTFRGYLKRVLQPRPMLMAWETRSNNRWWELGTGLSYTKDGWSSWTSELEDGFWTPTDWWFQPQTYSWWPTGVGRNLCNWGWKHQPEKVPGCSKKCSFFLSFALGKVSPVLYDGWKLEVWKNWSSIPNIGKDKTCLKPPASCYCWFSPMLNH